MIVADKIEECIFKNYSPLFPTWHRIAAIRSRPRRIFCDNDDDGYCYPIARQPICLHNLVVSKGEEMIDRILLQTAYKFMYDIAYVEVELINATALKVYNGSIDLNLPKNVKNDMLSIIVDEAFHAYVAIDFIEQVKNVRKEDIFSIPKSVELKIAMDKFIPKLPKNMQGFFEVVCICLGENTLTKELFEMTKYKSLNPFFHEVMADHMIDEGRHSAFFKKILSFIWFNADDDIKTEVGKILPCFILEYLSSTLRIEWDRELLYFLNFQEEEIDIIIKDIYPPSSNRMISKCNPVAKNLLDVLDRCHILSHKKTASAFREYELL